MGWLRSVSAGFPLSPDLVAKSRKIVTSIIKYNYLMPVWTTWVKKERKKVKNFVSRSESTRINLWTTTTTTTKIGWQCQWTWRVSPDFIHLFLLLVGEGKIGERNKWVELFWLMMCPGQYLMIGLSFFAFQFDELPCARASTCSSTCRIMNWYWFLLEFQLDYIIYLKKYLLLWLH